MKLSLVLLVALFCAGVSIAFEDNEFADFEEFDSDDDVAVKENPSQKVEATKEESKGIENYNELEDTDDGIVEDEFDSFDKDEFEGFGGGSDNNESPDLKKAGEPKLTMANVPLHFRKWDSYWIEILFLLGLVIYFVNYAMGKNKNIKIAEAWLSAHKTFLEENFALVGDDGKKETDLTETGIMMKESDSVFTLWCSGRICCEGNSYLSPHSLITNR